MGKGCSRLVGRKYTAACFGSVAKTIRKLADDSRRASWGGNSSVPRQRGHGSRVVGWSKVGWFFWSTLIDLRMPPRSECTHAAPRTWSLAPFQTCHFASTFFPPCSFEKNRHLRGLSVARATAVCHVHLEQSGLDLEQELPRENYSAWFNNHTVYSRCSLYYVTLAADPIFARQEITRIKSCFIYQGTNKWSGHGSKKIQRDFSFPKWTQSVQDARERALRKRKRSKRVHRLINKELHKRSSSTFHFHARIRHS